MTNKYVKLKGKERQGKKFTMRSKSMLLTLKMIMEG